MRGRPTPGALAPALLLLAACVAEPDYTGRLCSDEAPCPSGYVCLTGACQPAGLGPAPDGGRAPDASAMDGGPADAGAPDGGPDAGPPDVGAMDAGPALVAVRLSPTSATLAAGERVRFTATAEYEDGASGDVSAQATWRAVDPAVLTVDAGGSARGIAEGATLVEATFAGVRGQAAVSVTPAVPVEVSTFNKHNLARFSDGRVFAWGWNANAQVDDSGQETVTRPVQVGLTEAVMVRAGGTHSVAMREDGTVWAWGGNGGGQLGRGTTGADVATPRAVFAPSGAGALTGVQDVRCGYDFCLALTDAGRVLAWGANSFGALGLGGASNEPAVLPTEVPGLSDVVEIAAGTYHAVARTAGGAVFAWGYDEYGQLGQDTIGVHTSTPGRVVGVGGAGQLAGIVEIDAGWGHTLARAADGRVLAWGWAAYRQLGPAPTVDTGVPSRVLDAASSPLGQVTDLEAGFAFGLARTTGGEVLAWGNDTFGQLGAGAPTTTRAEPEPVLAAAGGAPFPGVTQLSAGGDHALAIAADQVWAWGSNVFGELGNGASGMGEQTATPARVTGF